MRGSTPSRHPAHTRQRRTSDGVRAGRSSRSSAPAPGVSCPLLCGPPRAGVIIGPAVEVMRCADHLCAYFLRGRSQGPAKVIHTRRRQRFRRVSFRPGGGSPLLGRFAAMLPPYVPLRVSPPWRLCAAFSFSGCKFTRLYFSFVLWLPCGVVRRLRLACVGVWRLPWPSAGRSRGGGALAYPAAGAPVWGLLGPSWGWPGSRHGRRRSGCAWRGQADFLRRPPLIAPPGFPGGCACLRQSRWG